MSSAGQEHYTMKQLRSSPSAEDQLPQHQQIQIQQIQSQQSIPIHQIQHQPSQSSQADSVSSTNATNGSIPDSNTNQQQQQQQPILEHDRFVMSPQLEPSHYVPGTSLGSSTSNASNSNHTKPSSQQQQQQQTSQCRVELISSISDHTEEIHLKMHYVIDGRTQDIKFPFHLSTDTIEEVVTEMVRENLVDARYEEIARKNLADVVDRVLAVLNGGGGGSRSASFNAAMGINTTNTSTVQLKSDNSFVNTSSSTDPTLSGTSTLMTGDTIGLNNSINRGIGIGNGMSASQVGNSLNRLQSSSPPPPPSQPVHSRSGTDETVNQGSGSNLSNAVATSANGSGSANGNGNGNMPVLHTSPSLRPNIPTGGIQRMQTFPPQPQSQSQSQTSMMVESAGTRSPSNAFNMITSTTTSTSTTSPKLDASNTMLLGSGVQVQQANGGVLNLEFHHQQFEQMQRQRLLQQQQQQPLQVPPLLQRRQSESLPPLKLPGPVWDAMTPAYNATQQQQQQTQPPAATSSAPVTATSTVTTVSQGTQFESPTSLTSPSLAATNVSQSQQIAGESTYIASGAVITPVSSLGSTSVSSATSNSAPTSASANKVSDQVAEVTKLKIREMQEMALKNLGNMSLAAAGTGGATSVGGGKPMGMGGVGNGSRTFSAGAQSLSTLQLQQLQQQQQGGGSSVLQPPMMTMPSGGSSPAMMPVSIQGVVAQIPATQSQQQQQQQPQPKPLGHQRSSSSSSIGSMEGRSSFDGKKNYN